METPAWLFVMIVSVDNQPLSTRLGTCHGFGTILLCLIAIGCGDDAGNQGPGRPNNHSDTNLPPVIAQMGTRTGVEGEQMLVYISAADPEGSRLFYAAYPLPENAVFDGTTGIMDWTPLLGASARSPYMIDFIVSDGVSDNHVTGFFNIDPAPFALATVTPDRIPQSGGTRLTVRGLGIVPPATVTLGGLPGTNVEVLDERFLEFDAPAFGTGYGPQTLVISLGDGRSSLIVSAVFVYRDGFDLSSGVGRYPLPVTVEDWAVGDLDGDEEDEILLAHDAGLLRLDPGRDRSERLESAYEQGTIQVETGFFDSDLLADVAVLTADGRVSALLSSEDGEVTGVYDGARPAIAFTTFDLEPDGDDEILVFDDDGGVWVYAATTATPSGFSEPIGSNLFYLPGEVSVANVEQDSAGDLLLGFQERFAVSTGVETGAFREARLIDDSTGYRMPIRHWQSTLESWELLALGQSSVGIFRLSEVSDWRLRESWEYDELDGERSLTLQNDEIELLTASIDWPATRVDNMEGDRFELASWQMTGTVVGPPVHGDFDGNGSVDMGLLSRDERAVVTIPRDLMTGRLQAPMGLFAGGGQTIVVGDFSYRGGSDVVVTGTETDGLPSQSIYQWGTGGRFRPTPGLLPSNEDADLVILADVTDNSWADIVVSDGLGTLGCFPSYAPSVYNPQVTSTIDGLPIDMVPLRRTMESTLIAILMEDGRVQLAGFNGICELIKFETLTDRARLLRANRVERFGTSTLLVLTRSGRIVRYFYNDDGLYESGGELDISEVSEPLDFISGDITGDGQNDYVVSSGDGVYLFAALPTASTLGQYTMSQVDDRGATEITVGDLNGDGTEEIVATGLDLPPRTIELVGTECCSTQELPEWHSAASSPVLADVDGDVDLDLITLEPDFGAVIWWNTQPQ